MTNQAWQLRRTSPKIWFVVVAVAIAVLISVAYVIYARSRQEIIPSAIQLRLSFSPFVLVDTENGRLQAASYKYDTQNQLFSFVVNAPSKGESFTVSEQISPPNFTEIPDLYGKLIDGLNGYGTMETLNGTVDLTRPQSGKQTAVMNERGVLLFIRSDKGDVSTTEWKHVIEALDIYKVKS